jgi:hypothetical protein
MLPASIRKRFATPGLMERQFLDYLEQANLRIDNSKTIASQSLYHQLNVTANTVNEFFTGTFVQADTNVPGSSFVRPQSEHFVIYAVRILTGTSDTETDVLYTPGNSTGDIGLSNTVATVNNNNITELKNYPLTEALSDLTTRDQGLIMLDEPILWGGQTELKVTLNLKAGAYTTLAVRIELLGIGLI